MASFGFKPEFKTPKVGIETNTKKERLAALATVTKGVQTGGQQIEQALPPLLDDALDANIWSWPRNSAWNGKGTTRSITDTGRLKASKNVQTRFLQTKTVFTIQYKAPYAALVHEGGYVLPYGDVRKQPLYFPGRPWISAVLSGDKPGVQYLDVVSYMKASIADAWG
mgnify:CR=1 FL=1